MSDPVIEFFGRMITESEARARHLLNTGPGTWEQFLADGEDPYASYSNTADTRVERESLVREYKKSYKAVSDTAPEGGARNAIRAKIGSALLTTAIAGLAQRRLGRVRSIAAQASRRSSMAARDIDALRTVAYDRWGVVTPPGSTT